MIKSPKVDDKREKFFDDLDKKNFDLVVKKAYISSTFYIKG